MRHTMRASSGAQQRRQLDTANQNIIANQKQQQQPAVKLQLPRLDDGPFEPQLELASARKRRARAHSGRLQLAAVVHYGRWRRRQAARQEAAGASSCDSARASSGDLALALALEADEQSRPAQAAGGLASKLARLFSRRRGRASAAKIDCERRAGEPGIMMDHLTATPPAPPPPPRPSEPLAADSPARRRPVIEFKLDLIVESDQDQDQDDDAREGAERARASSAPRKLREQLDELVAAFALDSMDVCLMSAGEPTSSTSCNQHSLDHSLELVEMALTRSFQLLRASGAGSDASIDNFSIHLEAAQITQTAASCDFAPPIEIADLLAAAAARSAKSPAPSESRAGQSIECRSLNDALEVLQVIRKNLTPPPATSGESAQSSLIVSLKLERLINGGAFANRLCLIDLGGEPGRSPLAEMLKSLFSGQALAHLKRQRVYLRSLQLQLDCVLRQSGKASSLKGNSLKEGEKQPKLEEDQEDEEYNNKKHHQIASLARLMQAEWLIYKQLSGALIRSLLIVHCHAQPARADQDKAAPTSGCGGGGQDELLMAHNLALLEFARQLQRASAGRWRRRRRHLRHRGHLSSATNLSAGAAPSSRAKAPELVDLELEEAYKQLEARHQHDLMISSPLRQRVASASGRRRASEAAGRRQLWRRRPSDDFYRSHEDDDDLNLDLDLDLDDLELTGSSCHSGRRRAACCRAGEHQSRYQPGRMRELDYCPSERALSSSRRRELAGGSSSLSTSSGSQRAGSSGRAARPTPLGAGSAASRLLGQLHGRRPARQLALPLHSDTEDSLASATLNSCSSLGAGSSSSSCHRRRLKQLQRAQELEKLFRAVRTQRWPADELAGRLPSDGDGDSSRSPESEAGMGEPHGVKRNGIGDQQQQQVEELGDNASDVCSVVAEPPRQLKLEEFLNQLSSAIKPARASHAQSEEASGRPANESEEEDCKSHSSLLEHLSSLTLESSARARPMIDGRAGDKDVPLNVIQQQREARSRVDIVSGGETGAAHAGRLQEARVAGGHLQQLLKSTLELHQLQGQKQAGRPTGGGGGVNELPSHLRIDCKTTDEARRAPSAGPPPTFTPTPSSDSCGSSSSASSSAASNNVSGAAAAADELAARSLAASLALKHHQLFCRT